MNPNPPPIVRTVSALRSRVTAWRESGMRVALAPTMGALHEGHLSLVRLGRAHADRAVVSIFVNPSQFGAHEDLDAYPRNEAADVEALIGQGCDLIYAPDVAAMYPRGFSTTIDVGGVSMPLDGAARPHHFEGVATVVTKLLVQCGPDVAVFGEKDYQQLQVIRRLTTDLDLPVEIVAAPTARADDGLALSSRNAYLTTAQRQIAGSLNVILANAATAVRSGAAARRVEAEGRAALSAAGFEKIDYFEVRAADDLALIGDRPPETPARVFAAAWLGKTRLIDNMPV